MNVSHKTIDTLKDAGWFPKRKLGDTVWEGWDRLIIEKGFMLWGSN